MRYQSNIDSVDIPQLRLIVDMLIIRKNTTDAFFIQTPSSGPTTHWCGCMGSNRRGCFFLCPCFPSWMVKVCLLKRRHNSCPRNDWRILKDPPNWRSIDQKHMLSMIRGKLWLVGHPCSFQDRLCWTLCEQGKVNTSSVVLINMPRLDTPNHELLFLLFLINESSPITDINCRVVNSFRRNSHCFVTNGMPRILCFTMNTARNEDADFFGFTKKTRIQTVLCVTARITSIHTHHATTKLDFLQPPTDLSETRSENAQPYQHFLALGSLSNNREPTPPPPTPYSPGF